MLDEEDIEAIADRVAAKLRLRTDGLVGVSDVARALGMSRAWVYRNADALGAQRLGGGRNQCCASTSLGPSNAPSPSAFLRSRLQRSRLRGGGVARRVASSRWVWN